MKLAVTATSFLLAQSAPSPIEKPWPCHLTMPRVVVCNGEQPEAAIAMFDRYNRNPEALFDDGVIAAVAGYGCAVVSRDRAGPGVLIEHGRAEVATLSGYKLFVVIDTTRLSYMAIDARWIAGKCPASKAATAGS